MREEQYQWPIFIERLKSDKHPRFSALAPLAELCAQDADISLLYPYTSLAFFSLSKKPWESEPHGFDRCFQNGLCALGEEDGKTISLLVGEVGFKDKTFTLAKGPPEYVFGILKAIYKKEG